MFTLLLLTRHGWTDILGCYMSHLPPNEWPTIQAAEAAAKELREVGVGDRPGDEWRVVPTADLDSYTLVDCFTPMAPVASGPPPEREMGPHQVA